MLRKNRLFTPGPTPLLPAAQTAMASFTAHHRTADFRQLFQRVLADMKDFVGTQSDVLVLACSGTGVMEASVSNLTSPGDKVLVLTAGKFGERWTGLARAFGCNVDVLSVPYGQTFSLHEIRAKVTPEVKAVFVQATESSTGTRHDVEGIAKIVRASGDGTLLVVDAITGLGYLVNPVTTWTRVSAENHTSGRQKSWRKLDGLWAIQVDVPEAAGHVAKDNADILLV